MADGKNQSAAGALVSSPLATGGSGTFFEQHVDAHYLALLLVGGLPPVLTDCVLVEVSLQVEHLGWETDDVLLVGERGDGTRRHFAAQAKREISIAESDEAFVKALRDFWTDFKNASVFSEGLDQFGLVVLLGNKSTESFQSLCDCARASRDAADFSHRITTDGFINARVRRTNGVVLKIIEDFETKALDPADYWRFLKSIHVVALDLNTSSSVTETLTKSLLALAATGSDKAGEAQKTWTELLALVGQGMPFAKTFTRESLPEPMRLRHQNVPASSTIALTRAREHSDITLRGISTKLGGALTLERSAVVSELLHELNESPIVLVAGPAGSGKSALTKMALSHVASTTTILAFRAEEFAHVHIDQALLHSQIPGNAETLRALLAGQGRKLLLIESVERILEATHREAFKDLLRWCATDPTWQIVLTCRDYSVDIIRSSFLDELSVQSSIIRVPPLSNGEIDEVVAKIPTLKRPASHHFLRELFRIPYIFDKATRMAWPEDGTLPNDERSFRKKFWKEVVRRDDVTHDNLPRRREDAFAALCLRRAKALEPFAPCNALDGVALEALRNDSLVTYSPATNQLAAPAHDVLEDWAVIEWTGERFALHGSNRLAFATELGPFPAIRRAYRRWLSELSSSDPAAADAFILDVIRDASLPAFFKDDTLAAILRSSEGGAFLSRNRGLMAANSGALLRRVIHLVRVACKTTPPWAKRIVTPHWFIPDGPAWAAMLALVRQELQLFIPKDIGLIVGLLTDWSAGIAWWAPAPEGASDAVTIAFELIPHVDRYDSEELLEQLFKVILKAPTGNPTAFEKLVDKTVEGSRSDPEARDFSKLALNCLDSSFACRDTPDAIIRIAEASYFEPDDERHRGGLPSMEVSSTFGLRDSFELKYFPPSTLQGPFAALLKNHPQKAVEFILGLLNRACDVYGTPFPGRQIELPWKVTLTLPNGTAREFWCSHRLWGLYRAQEVGPDVLISALMSLEDFLLNLAKSKSQYLEQWLTYVLNNSNNVAAVAVVASAVLSDPKNSGRAALSVLTSPDLLLLDRQRMVAEMRGQFPLPLQDAIGQMIAAERKASQELPHRRFDLETVMLQLQLGPLKNEVHALLDSYEKQLPPVAEQTQEHQLWRLALIRMDLRKLKAEAVTAEEASRIEKASPEASGKQIVKFVPAQLDSDLQALLDEKEPGQEEFIETTSVFMWAHKAFEYEEGSGQNWQAMLKRARTMPEKEVFGDNLAIQAPRFVAAVCARDHWSELTDDDRIWCTQKLVAAVASNADATDLTTQVSNNSFDAAGAAASVLPLIYRFCTGEDARAAVLKSILVGVTHAVTRVARYAAAGIGRHLCDSHPELVRGFAGVVARQANRFCELRNEAGDWRYLNRLRQKAREEARSAGLPPPPCTTAELDAVDFTEWDAVKALMGMLSYCPGEPLASHLFKAVAAKLLAVWKTPRHEQDHRNFYFEGDCDDYLAKFALKLHPKDATSVISPILEGIEIDPGEVKSFVKALLTFADGGDSNDCYWELWGECGNAILKASWLDHLDGRHPSDDGLLRAMFFGTQWKKGVTHWPRLEGKADVIDGFFEKLPPVATVFAAYVSFLYDIGEHSLPKAFLVLERRMQEGDALRILSNGNTRFCLEILLQRYVYGKPTVLKESSELKNAVLYLLDQLVEAGSSIAYRMRDDFVTPGN